MRSRTQSIVSTLLLVTSFALLVAVGVLYVRDRNDSSEPTPPTAIPGHNQAIDVLNAFRDQDLNAKFGPQGTDVRSVMLERPGQMIALDSGTAYIFIYPDIASLEDATLDVLAEDVDLKDIAGDALTFDSIDLFTGSNVAVVLVDGDEQTAERVEAAVDELT